MCIYRSITCHAMYMYILTMYFNVCTGHQSAGIFHVVYDISISCKADGHKAGAYQHKAHGNYKATGGDGDVPETSSQVSKKDVSASSCI